MRRLLNPREHGECFVTRDGAETDFDLGHYERFLDIELTRKNITLTGKLMWDLIAMSELVSFVVGLYN
jgi:CTP synthase